jgi:hypothetical protein
MRANQDLIGKTISGVVAVNQPGDGVREIWMLQFSDGSHVEFVSPTARRQLRRNTSGSKMGASRPHNGVHKGLNIDPQLALNVA